MCAGLLKASEAKLIWGTRVAAIRADATKGGYRLWVHEANKTVSVLEYDAVIVATPLQESKIVFDEAVREQVCCGQNPYVTCEGTPKKAFFLIFDLWTYSVPGCTRDYAAHACYVCCWPP
jgi:hypothetical protein